MKTKVGASSNIDVETTATSCIIGIINKMLKSTDVSHTSEIYWEIINLYKKNGKTGNIEEEIINIIHGDANNIKMESINDRNQKVKTIVEKLKEIHTDPNK